MKSDQTTSTQSSWINTSLKVELLTLAPFFPVGPIICDGGKKKKKSIEFIVFTF